MKKLNAILLSLFVLSSVQAFADESGVLFRGQKFVFFQDGKKTAQGHDDFKKAQAAAKTEKREPAAVVKDDWANIRYQRSGKTTCYYMDSALSCVAE